MKAERVVELDIRSCRDPRAHAEISARRAAHEAFDERAFEIALAAPELHWVVVLRSVVSNGGGGLRSSLRTSSG